MALDDRTGLKYALPANRQHFYGGKWHASLDGGQAPVSSPATGGSAGCRERGRDAGCRASGRGRGPGLRRVARYAGAGARGVRSRRVSGAAQACGGARLDRRDRRRQSVRSDALRRGDQRELHGLLRRPRHRDEGRDDPDQQHGPELHDARAPRRDRTHRCIQPPAALRRRKGRRAARCRQYPDRQARGADAAVGTTRGRTLGRHLSTRRVQHRDRRSRRRRRARR